MRADNFHIDEPANPMPPKWLDWVRRLQAIAQSGLTYARDRYDIERYESLREIAAEIGAEGFGSTIHLVREVFSQQAGYATPKIDVRAVVFRDNKVLLVKEREDGAWALPGGWADVGESPAAAAVREVREESGFETRAIRLLAVYDRNRHGHPPIPFHAYKLFFLCDLLGGVPITSNETDGVDWFAEGCWPPLSLTRVTPPQLHRFFEHHRNPLWPTDFD
jgi:ADP-ribose pyrophosphatase YjhB (NUDIX family)